ncbi:hypothetical protein C8R45DRAFT_1219618 [Mycena sanguinolenta]|nr:hypothetical protein C8R45DRAFT_1219618 [Mycena sanguinolenta]
MTGRRCFVSSRRPPLFMLAYGAPRLPALIDTSQATTHPQTPTQPPNSPLGLCAPLLLALISPSPSTSPSCAYAPSGPPIATSKEKLGRRSRGCLRPALSFRTGHFSPRPYPLACRIVAEPGCLLWSPRQGIIATSTTRHLSHRSPMRRAATSCAVAHPTLILKTQTRKNGTREPRLTNPSPPPLPHHILPRGTPTARPPHVPFAGEVTPLSVGGEAAAFRAAEALSFLL